jgi:AcrR family transcriptional regulator
MEERARRIVETAVELAEKGGFEAVRLRDVASHAGVALGTLYRRFRSKEDLLLAALEQEIEDVEARVARRPPEGATPLERVTSFFQMTTRALCRRPNLARALLRAVATGEPELTQKVAAFHTHMEELITTALRGAPVSATDSPSDEERELAFVLQQVWFASLIGWSGGLHGQSGIVEQTRAAARLVLSSGRAG